MNMMAGGSQSALRAGNVTRITDALTRAGTLSQAELVTATSLSHATVSNLIGLLKAEGRVEVTRGRRNGRPVKLVRLAQVVDGTFLAVYVEPDRITVGLGALAEQTLTSSTMNGLRGLGYQEALDLIHRTSGALFERAGLDPDTLTGVGLAMAAAFDPEAGRVARVEGRLPQFADSWLGAPVVAEVARLLGAPTAADNDANLAALAEARLGAARGCRDVIYLHLSAGVGAGLILDGRPYRGTLGRAGELGHSTCDPGGNICHCGNRGCLETLVGETALLEPLRQAYGPDLSMDEFVALARDGDAGCRRVVEDAAAHIGTVLAGVVNLLAPGRVVLGGELAEAGDVLVDGVRHAVERLASPTVARPSTVTSAFGRDAVLVGALIGAAEITRTPVDFKDLSHNRL